MCSESICDVYMRSKYNLNDISVWALDDVQVTKCYNQWDNTAKRAVVSKAHTAH